MNEQIYQDFSNAYAELKYHIEKFILLKDTL